MRSGQAILSLLLLLVVSLFNLTKCADNTGIVMLVKKPFPRAMDSEQLPLRINDEPVVVTVALTISRLSNFAPITETFDADVNLKCGWQDGRYFNDGDNTVLMDAESVNDIWIPDLYFYNAQSITTHTIMKPNHYLYIGEENASPDKQIKLIWREWDPVQLARGIVDGSHMTEMIILGAEPTDCGKVELFEDDNYYDDKTVAKTVNRSCVAARIRMKRRPTSYIFETYVPTAVIVFLSMFSFLLEPFSPGARVALCFTVFLTLATTMARANRFAVSYATAIALWMMVCNLFVFAVLAEFGLVHYIVSQGLRDKPIPSDGVVNPPERSRQKAWLVDKICLVAFPTLFTIFIIAYWCIYGINWNHHDGK